MSDDPDQSGGSWTMLTGHGHVLVEIARNPGVRIRDISAVVGLTERTVQAISGMAFLGPAAAGLPRQVPPASSIAALATLGIVNTRRRLLAVLPADRRGRGGYGVGEIDAASAEAVKGLRAYG